MTNGALYIHIPFCIRKCNYCDFTSFNYNEEKVEEYITLLLKEIDMYAEKVKEYKFKTLFFGGGTPSLIDEKYIYKIMNRLEQKFNLSLDETTIESNPKTLTRGKLLAYKDMGINRISMGVQSLDDSILKDIGRSHGIKDFLDTYELIKNVGFSNINTDIMFNLPNQSIDNMITTLKGIISLDVPHISFYSLKIEENTNFFEKYKSGNLNVSDEDTEREMYHKGIELLEENDIYQYEISNFSKKGFECEHNMYYWKLKPYLGLGLSSHSNMFNKRWGNTSNYNNYKDNILNNKFPILDTEIIDKKTKMSEYIILGLRLNEGISIEGFKKRFNVDIYEAFNGSIDYSLKYGLIDINREKIYLTKKGLDLSNVVFKEFIE
ncbi:radical SAM family heme chaperone HemW [Clostridium sp. D2Q-11]|uniref:Heme chaperone HemW n=1 Tax=Anaeromonas frigoriresistens TaxID=2683708 RepID=A0A942Z752_9FIRM|nr:radical SAM family heme chaperone HemW [Anaeromonas frigoriresistens]MBS4536873.1 radical SAM family heme chaperone HemW [Anaeromonas frigoriresistens]